MSVIQNHLSTLYFTVNLFIVVGLSIRVILRRLPVGVSLAWLVLVFSVPFAGAIAYLIFGEKRLGRERRERELAAIREVMKVTDLLNKEMVTAGPPAGSSSEPIYRHVQSLLTFQALLHNRLRLLTDFESIFDSIIADIDAAQHSCRLGFYIWNEGGRTDEVIDALIRARSRGVTCRVMADSMGSKRFFKGKAAAMLRDEGVEFVIALRPSIRRRADLRNHRKLIIIDDLIGYTGSQNMVDPRFFKQDSGVGRWVDAMVRVEGPSVTLLSNVFQVDWCVEGDLPFEPAIHHGKDSEDNKDPGTLLQVVPSGPVFQPQAIYQLILTAIYSARREIIITTPYFIPDDAVVTALLSAALRGVQVTIIIPARNDSFLVRHASASHFDRLLRVGVRIALFEGGLLHTKSIVIDGEFSLFGSVNLDMRSLWLNFELSLFIYDTGFASELKAMQDVFLAQSTMADIKEWRDRPTHLRIVDDTIRLFGPLL